MKFKVCRYGSKTNLIHTVYYKLKYLHFITRHQVRVLHDTLNITQATKWKILKKFYHIYLRALFICFFSEVKVFYHKEPSGVGVNSYLLFTAKTFNTYIIVLHIN